MANGFNPFLDPNMLPPDFLGGIAGNPSEAAPDPTSGYMPLLDPVILGGVGGSDPVRSGVPQNIADFYGGILNIGQPDAGYFDEFRLPGDDRVLETGPTLDVANPTDVTDTRVPFDPDFYTEIAQAIGGNRGGYDDTEMMARLADMQATIDGMQPVETPVFEEAVVNDPPVFVADSTPNFLPFDDSYILEQLQSLQDQQQSFLPSEPVFAPTYDDTVLRQQMDDFQNQLTNLPAVDTSQFLTAQDLPTYDTSQFLTAQDLPTYQQFDPTQLQDQINQLALTQPMDTSQFLTAADLPTYDTSQFLTAQDLPTFQQFDPTGLQQQIDAFQQAPAVDTSQFLTAADLPTFQQFDPTGLQQQINELQTTPAVDTSQFLTAADLPTYDTSTLESEIAELRKQLNRNTTSTPALTTPTFDGILPNFGGFNVR